MSSPTLEAIMAIRADRVNAYGKPEDNFRQIAAYWSAYLSQNISNIVSMKSPGGTPEISLRPGDIAKLMALLKIARDNRVNRADNMIDGANYLVIAGDLQYPADAERDPEANQQKAEG